MRKLYIIPKHPRLSQNDIIEFLEKNPCSTETEIQIGCWGYYRSKSSYSNKKYADCLRRAFNSGKIDRVRVKLKGENRYYYRYFIKGHIQLN